MATTMEDVMTVIGIGKFRIAVTDSGSVVVNALSIFAGKYSHTDIYTCAAHILHLTFGDIIKLKST
jgi:hypothetical protein